MVYRTRAAFLAASIAAVCPLSCVPPAVDTRPRDVDLDPARKSDRLGNPLPPGAVARLGHADDAGAGGSHGLSFSPDGSLVAFIANDGDTRIWDVKAEAELHRFAHDPTRFPTNNDRRVFTTDGKLLIGDGGVVWDVATGRTAERFGLDQKVNSGLPMGYPTPSPDGKTVLFATHPGFEAQRVGEVVVYDIPSRKEVRRFGKGTQVGGPLVLSPDGRTLAAVKLPVLVVEPAGGPNKGDGVVALDDATSGVLLWDPATGENKAAWQWQSGRFGQGVPVGFSADGKTLHVLADEKLVAWDVAAGKPSGEPFGSWMRAAVQLPDRRTLAVAEPAGLALWSIPGKKQVGRVDRPVAWVVGMAPSPTGRWLATGGSDGTVLVWDVAALGAKR